MGGGGGGLHWSTSSIREYQQSDRGRQAEGVMEFGMSRRIKDKIRKEYVHISMKDIECNLYGPPKRKKKELRNILELVGQN